MRRHEPELSFPHWSNRIVAVGIAIASLVGVTSCAVDNISASNRIAVTEVDKSAPLDSLSAEQTRSFTSPTVYESALAHPQEAYSYLHEFFGQHGLNQRSISVDYNLDDNIPPRIVQYYDIGEIYYETYESLINAFADANGYSEGQTNYNGRMYTFQLRPIHSEDLSAYSGVIIANNPTDSLYESSSMLAAPDVVLDSMLQTQYGFGVNDLTPSQHDNLSLLALGLRVQEHQSQSFAGFGARGMITPNEVVLDLDFNGLEQLQQADGQGLQTA